MKRLLKDLKQASIIIYEDKNEPFSNLCLDSLESILLWTVLTGSDNSWVFINCFQHFAWQIVDEILVEQEDRDMNVEEDVGLEEHDVVIAGMWGASGGWDDAGRWGTSSWQWGAGSWCSSGGWDGASWKWGASHWGDSGEWCDAGKWGTAGSWSGPLFNWRGAWNKALSDFWCNIKSLCVSKGHRRQIRRRI